MNMSVKFCVGVVCGLACVWPGCVSTIDGKSTGGWPIAKDTVESRYDRPLATVWKASEAALASAGTLTVKNVIGYTLEAKVETRTVWVALDVVTTNTTRVVTQVRTKGGGTDQALAHEIDKQIAMRLATGNYAPTPPPAPAAPKPK
jgi:hypothetical protein